MIELAVVAIFWSGFEMVRLGDRTDYSFVDNSDVY
jgi:hypothetical protein